MNNQRPMFVVLITTTKKGVGF